MEMIVPGLVILYFVMWISVFCLGLTFKQRLKKLYPDLGTSLHPGILNKSIATDINSTRFLLRRDYRTLDNQRFVSFCDRYRAMVIAWYIVFGVTIVTLIVFSITHGKHN